MGHERTEQEVFWASEFGNEYITRNTLDSVPARIACWSRMLKSASVLPQSILELGCNIGGNLHALHALLPKTELHAIEINPLAVQYVKEWGKATVSEGSLLEFKAQRKFDLTFTAGVLIHIAPEKLSLAYDALYQSSSRYVLISEYYNPSPAEIRYRGHTGKLFKRDFCGEMLDRFSDLRLIDYGFFYHRDPLCTSDDATFFLMEKV